MINVDPTAEVIEKMANLMRKFASELDGISAKMRISHDIGFASEAITAVVNCIQNLRLDLLVTRPIREYERFTSMEENK